MRVRAVYSEPFPGYGLPRRLFRFRGPRIYQSQSEFFHPGSRPLHPVLESPPLHALRLGRSHCLCLSLSPEHPSSRIASRFDYRDDRFRSRPYPLYICDGGRPHSFYIRDLFLQLRRDRAARGRNRRGNFLGHYGNDPQVGGIFDACLPGAAERKTQIGQGARPKASSSALLTILRESYPCRLAFRARPSCNRS